MSRPVLLFSAHTWHEGVRTESFSPPDGLPCVSLCFNVARTAWGSKLRSAVGPWSLSCLTSYLGSWGLWTRPPSCGCWQPRSGEQTLHFLWVLGSILPAKACSQLGPCLGGLFAVLQGIQDAPPLGSSSPPSPSVGRDTWTAREAGAVPTWWKRQGWARTTGPWVGLL